MPLKAVAWCVASYIVGAFPTGYLLTYWLKGVDIRTLGSGNPGATNVMRSVSRSAGIITLIVDAFKGWLCVWAVQQNFANPWVHIAAGFAAVAGHTWSPFLRFNGGKGVATSAGVFAALLPIPLGVAFVAFCLGVAMTKHVSVGSLASAVCLPVFAVALYGWIPATILACVLCGVIIVRHISNIKRLMRGQELLIKNQNRDTSGKGSA